MKQPCIICDLDNTIACTKHRAHFLDERPKNWDAFNAACIEDRPMTHIIRLLRGMYEYPIIITSGRDEAVRPQTERWLWDHEVPYNKLFMRNTGDYTEDSELKEHWLDTFILPTFTPIFALDDRNRVVAMWRRRGIPCLQVQDGDF